MATIRRREGKKGVTYQVRVRRSGHRDITETFDRKSDAEVFARSVEGDQDRLRALGQSEAAVVTTYGAFDRYIRQWNGKDHTGLARIRYWQERLSGRLLTDIDKPTVREELHELADGDRSASTVNRYHTSLSAFLQFCVEEYDLQVNVARQIRKRKEPRGRVRYLTEEERMVLLAACDASEWPLLGLLVRMALTTGARRSELLGLTWHDIDLDRGTATVEEDKAGERRTLPLVPEIASALRELRPNDFTHRVFPNQDDPTKKKPIDGVWKTALRRAGLTNFQFHDLRHTAASYLAMTGRSLPQIGYLLGHKSPTTTQRYAHLQGELVHELAGDLAKRL